MEIICNANLMGFNIPYPYEQVPAKTTESRLGLWTIQGLVERMLEDAKIRAKAKEGEVYSCDIDIDDIPETILRRYGIKK